MENYYVLIIEHETGKEVRRMGPMSESRAYRVEDGASINLNHEKFYTDIVQGEAE